MKHIGHHMEEIAFGVVSTAYENWSYDESGSEVEPLDTRTLDCVEFDHYPSPSDSSGNGFFGPTTNSTHATPVTENFTESWGGTQYAHDDTQYELNYWTGNMTAVSPASSENSGLRDPYPVDYLSTGSLSSDSNSYSGRKSTSEAQTKRSMTATRKQSKYNAERSPTEKRVGRWRGPLKPAQRKQSQEIRNSRACLRCKFLKKTCDKGDPCGWCKYARRWFVPCTRIAIKDLGDFLHKWKADYARHTAVVKFSPSDIGRFSRKEQIIYITHGFGHWLPLFVRYFRDDLEVQISLENISPALIGDYLDKHIDGDFENFIEDRFKKTLFLSDCLKTLYRYFLKNQSVLLRKALRFIIAYSLTLKLTIIEGGTQHNETSPNQQSYRELFFGETPASTTIDSEVKLCLAARWRAIHKELLEELDTLYTSVYSGERLKNWDKIFFLTLIVLTVWEKLQYECYLYVRDDEFCREFCRNMEEIPVGVLVGLFSAISQRLPFFEEWETRTHGHVFFDQNDALHDMLTEMRANVLKYGELAEACVDGLWLILCDRELPAVKSKRCEIRPP